MRPVHLADLDAATRVVMAAAEADRALVAAELVRAADIADRFRKRLGKAHPDFGTGTLTSATAGWPRAPVLRIDKTYRICLSAVIRALQHQSA